MSESSRVIDMNNLGDVFAADWTSVVTSDQWLGTVIACHQVMTWTQQTVTLAIHADCTVFTGLWQRDCIAHMHTYTQTYMHSLSHRQRLQMLHSQWNQYEYRFHYGSLLASDMRLHHTHTYLRFGIWSTLCTNHMYSLINYRVGQKNGAR